MFPLSSQLIQSEKCSAKSRKHNSLFKRPFCRTNEQLCLYQQNSFPAFDFTFLLHRKAAGGWGGRGVHTATDAENSVFAVGLCKHILDLDTCPRSWRQPSADSVYTCILCLSHHRTAYTASSGPLASAFPLARIPRRATSIAVSGNFLRNIAPPPYTQTDRLRTLCCVH